MIIPISQNSFAGGEWAKSLYGRTDLAKYITAVRKMLNAYPHPHGGVSNRQGLEFIGQAASSGLVRLIPFQFSVTQGYILEFSHLKMRVIKDGGYVLTTGGAIYELATPYSSSYLQLLKYTQNADVLFLFNPGVAPRKLERYDHDNWAISAITFGSSVSAPTNVQRSGSGTGCNYVVTAVNTSGEESLQSSAVAGGPEDTITWNNVSGAEYYNVYKDRTGAGVYGWIGQANSTSFKDVGGIVPDYGRTPPKNRTPFSGAGNYPGCGTFFEQRLIYARTDNEPQSFFGSIIGAPTNMNSSTPIKDDDAFKFTLNSNQVNEVRWLVPLTSLIVGTVGGEWKVAGGSSGEAIKPTSVSTKPQSKWGVSHVQPIVIGDSILFLDREGKKARDLMYSLEKDGYTGNDLSILANHLFKDNYVKAWAYQQTPDSIIWCVLDDGKLVGLTYFREHEVWGWHRHETDGYVQEVACITNSDGKDDVYIAVQRNINGNWVKYIERFSQRLPKPSGASQRIEDAFFVDSGLTYDGWNNKKGVTLTGSSWNVGSTLTMTCSDECFSEASIGRYYLIRAAYNVSVMVKVTAFTSAYIVSVQPVNRPVPEALRGVQTFYWAIMAKTITGLNHLEGREVVALADGNVVKNLTVTSGSVTLPNPAAKAHIGLPYVTDIETMDFEAQTQEGTLQDKKRTVESVMLKLEDTRALFVGGSESGLLEIPFRENEDYGEPTAMFSGDKEVFLEPGEGRLFMRNVDPVPMTVLSLVARVDYGDA